ncbi:uncharacterized protein I303_103443 [Kwoniella dejecticola CBS 10117]|uniref:MADS-box domain-containing protein n=1 Tax=Kwoniella dejecticola CBS 10117 TaxID=1296121 RepID=A0A1A6A6R8_9TREE|nr:uncharacterized protein I303_03466 [Kwoniella dejecticola CBS 10117]OBR85754.1 hypothetical protein I303_03466 [Kwoniella dejecticola CBS 10117]
MGRKKIEIRPLTDERNRNVTFLKRKAGLMKKAWELSVLCGADVNILIFNVAGKAYEFSSKELDEEIDRYMDYEGMIERRRAPEFAAMALAGEDEEDEDEDEPSNRRGSTSKAGANAANANAGANGAAPRSLKGKESFKARTPRHSGGGEKGRHSKSRSGKSRRRKERSESEKRSFIDSILSESETSDSSDETDSRKRRKEKEKERRERRKEEERYHQHDKNSDALQYAMNMHSSHPQAHAHAQTQQDPRYAHIHANAHPQHLHAGRERYYDVIEGGSRHPSSLPVDIPQLPKLPSDGPAYRSAMTSGLGSNPTQTQYYGTSSTSSSSLPQSEYLSTSNSNLALGQHQFHQQGYSSLSSSSNFPPPNLSAESPCHSLLPAQSFVSPTSAAQQGSYGNIQWNEQLIAKYAEFQLQQNHQRQQRLLLERQRHQLQQMGVPVDERSLLDEIFGGGGGGGNTTQSQAQTPSAETYNNASTVGTSSSMILPLELDDSLEAGPGQAQTHQGQGQGDFIWPLASGPASGSGTGTGTGTETNHHTPNVNSIDDPQDQFTGIGLSRQQNPRAALPNEGIAWGVQDGYNVDREELNLPSPISNGNGGVYEGKRKIRREDSDMSLKRIRM